MKSYFEVLILLIVIHSELLFIQDLPNLKKIYQMFLSIPKGCLNNLITIYHGRSFSASICDNKESTIHVLALLGQFKVHMMTYTIGTEI